MNRIKIIRFISLILVFFLAACNIQANQDTPTLASPQIAEPGFTPSGTPLTEAEVPRISLDDAKSALEAGTAVFVDVRIPTAFEDSHIPGAINIPLEEIERNPTSLPLDKEQWIITYCTWMNEHTSARAAHILLYNGYNRVTPILGGFDAWLKAGFPVEP